MFACIVPKISLLNFETKYIKLTLFKHFLHAYKCFIDTNNTLSQYKTLVFKCNVMVANALI
ncbi:conserved hypothetical protein [Trichinella spiralis]|uniref:hypothetical protein n=1 Tax=Trichinella spiralis TaxID=6334 RepID=UPI0001EFCE2D|nr:conserved hypothetical protein [Trichinella spiralis]